MGRFRPYISVSEICVFMSAEFIVERSVRDYARQEAGHNDADRNGRDEREGRKEGWKGIAEVERGETEI